MKKYGNILRALQQAAADATIAPEKQKQVRVINCSITLLEWIEKETRADLEFFSTSVRELAKHCPIEVRESFYTEQKKMDKIRELLFDAQMELIYAANEIALD